MITHRLKTEFKEHKIVLAIWLITLCALPYIVFFSLKDVFSKTDYYAASMGFWNLAIFLVLFIFLSKVLGQDKLKNVNGFWTTRPIRKKTIHYARFLYLLMTVTIPVMFIMGSTTFLMDRPEMALAIALEWGAYSFIIIGFSYYVSLASIRSPLLMYGSLVVAMILASIAISVGRPALQEYYAKLELSSMVNGVVLIFILIISLSYVCWREIKLRYQKVNLMIPALLGIFTMLWLIAQPFKVDHIETISPELKSSPPKIIAYGNGYKGEANYIEFHLSSIASLALKAGQISVVSSKAEFEGLSDEHSELMHIVANIGRSNQEYFIITPKIQFFDKKLKSFTSSGSGSFDESGIRELPNSFKTKLKWELVISHTEDEVLNSVSVLKAEEFDRKGVKYKLTKLNNELNLNWLSTNPMTLMQSRENNRIDIYYPEKQFVLLPGGGGSGTFPFFKFARKRFEISDRELTALAKKNNFSKDEAIAHVLAESKVSVIREKRPKYYRINIEVPIALPDPDKILELLNLEAINLK